MIGGKRRGIFGVHGRLRRMICGALAAALLAAACVAEPELRPENIRATAEYLCNEISCRPAGSVAERSACDHLALQLEALGFSQADGTLLRSAFDGLQGMRSENLTAICNGGRDELPLVSIVAHYDSVATSPGARDNAAAVGILLELARVLGREAALPCEIRMVFLGSEENGYHGAKAYVQSLTDQDRARHIAAFNMDISAASPSDAAEPVIFILGGHLPDGRYADAEFLPACTNSVADAAARAWAAAHGERPRIFVYGESDHIRFHEAELEAVNLCMRRLEDGLPRLPESYHQMHDLPEELDYDAAAQLGACILDAIALLCAPSEVDGTESHSGT